MKKSEITVNKIKLQTEMIEYLEKGNKSLSQFSKETGISISALSRIRAGEQVPDLLSLFVLVWHLRNGQPDSLKEFIQYEE